MPWATRRTRPGLFDLEGKKESTMPELEMTLEDVRSEILAIIESPDLDVEVKLERIAELLAGPKETMESLARQRSRRAEDHARTLLEAACAPINVTNIAAVANLPTEELRRKLVETLAERRPQRPFRSAPLIESHYAAKREPGGKGLANSIRGLGFEFARERVW